MPNDHSQSQFDFSAALRQLGDWQQTYAFNFLPLEYIHQTRLPETLGVSVIKAAGQSASVSGHLNKYLLEEFDLLGRWITGFDNALSRALALMPSSLFNDVVRFLGLCSAGQTIRNLMIPDDVRQCRKQIGTAEFDFVLSKSPLIAPQKILPESNMPIDEITNENLLASGAAVLNCGIEPCSDALMRRLELKLPKTVLLESGDIDLSHSVASGIIKRVIREVAPQWHSA